PDAVPDGAAVAMSGRDAGGASDRGDGGVDVVVVDPAVRDQAGAVHGGTAVGVARVHHHGVLGDPAGTGDRAPDPVGELVAAQPLQADDHHVVLAVADGGRHR